MDFFELIKKQISSAELLNVNCLNWDDFTYNPGLCARIAAVYRKNIFEGLTVFFYVEKEQILCRHTETNAMVCEDSCAEFFFQFPGEEGYYNLEMNACGVVHFAYGSGRSARRFIDPNIIEKNFNIQAEFEAPCHEPAQKTWSVKIYMKPEAFVFTSHDNLLRIKDEGVFMNIYKCGDLTQKPHYVTYFPVFTSAPDFHAADFFKKYKMPEIFLPESLDLNKNP